VDGVNDQTPVLAEEVVPNRLSPSNICISLEACAMPDITGVASFVMVPEAGSVMIGAARVEVTVNVAVAVSELEPPVAVTVMGPESILSTVKSALKSPLLSVGLVTLL
jgi:hypothetical protein